MRKILLATTLIAFGTGMAWGAVPICPGAMGANNFPHAPDSSGTGCNTVITVNPNGSTTVTIPDSVSFDASDETLVGVVNNSATPVASLSLSGPSIFGFEEDGICTFTFVGSSYCSPSQVAGTDPQDYYGPTSTFSVTNVNSGRVNFSPAVPANGGTTYFSLEFPPSASLTATVGPSGPSVSVPAASPAVIAALCVLLAGSLAWLLRRRPAGTQG